MNMNNSKLVIIRNSKTQTTTFVTSCTTYRFQNLILLSLFQIVIGGYGNMRTDLRRGPQGQILRQVNTDKILNCQEYRQYWVSWKDAITTLGSGELGTHTIFSYPDADEMYDIKHVSISSWNNNGGEWRIPEQEGEGGGVLG